MVVVEPTLSRSQCHVVFASYMGWMLDAFDYFLVVFVLRRLSIDFQSNINAVTWALTLTLALRPVGAFVFGRAADRYGRRPILMATVLLYAITELASAFSASLSGFLVLRALYGVAMGGEWGVGASLAFESVPARARGWVSGLLQSGYPSGYLLAALVFGSTFDHIGWRGMFIFGALLPALLVVYINYMVPESPAWRAESEITGRKGAALAAHWPIVLYAVALMTAFNFFSHGSQDLYPTFLASQRNFADGTVSLIAILYNVGAICGGLLFGRLSNRFGRRRTIAFAALLALPALPFWGYAHTALGIALAAFVMQFMVQGAWGVVPVHLNELSPPGVRATFPGVVYQLGNLLASANATFQALIAVHSGSAEHPDYAFALVAVCGVVAVCLAVLVLLGPERAGAPLQA